MAGGWLMDDGWDVAVFWSLQSGRPEGPKWKREGEGARKA